MKTLIRHTFPFALFALLLLPAYAGCDTASDGPGTRVLDGEARPMGNGTVRASVVLDENGDPVAYTLALTEAALTGLPTGGDHLSHHNALSLDFPAASGKNPFTHAFVNWNPAGHEPPGIYDTPHFDFHFYTSSEAEREAILPSDAQGQAKAENLPEARFLPAGYITPPPVLSVPMMGVHWVDTASPELNGQPFTSTLLYGSYDGRLTFIEPMITKAFIESVKAMPAQQVTFDVAQPQAFQKPGFYPTKYSVRYDANAGEYLISMESLVRR
jgi:hypothetical protein